MKQYRCRGCGAIDSIVEVELVPRVHDIRPDETGDGFEYGDMDEAAWEASTTLGYGCSNEACRYWQGQYGESLGHDSEDREMFEHAPGFTEGPDEIAEVIEA
jgi:hypothetical protein